MTTAPPLVCIIEPDGTTAAQIHDWLAARPERPNITLSTAVQSVEKCVWTEGVDWLFIRTQCWDAMQHLALSLPLRPRRVVFLSGRHDKGTDQLPATLDAHLKPPFRPRQLTKTWERLASPAYDPQPLDFFFLRTAWRLVLVRYGDLRLVRRQGLQLLIETRHADYTITSSLAAFQRRLPIPLSPIRPGWLINEAYHS